MSTEVKGKKSKSFKNSTVWEYIQVLAVAFFLVFGFMRPFVVEAFKIPSLSMADTLLIGDRILVAKFMYGITVPFVNIPQCSIGIEHESELGKGSINFPAKASQELRDTLSKEGLELSENAVVGIVKPDKEWVLTDNSKTYYATKSRGKLKISTKLRILDFHKPEVGDIFVFTPPPGAGKTQSFIKRIVGLPGDVIEVRNGDLYRNGEAVAGEEYVKRYRTSPRSPQFGRITVPPGHVFAMGDNRDRSSDSRVWGPVPIENIKGQAFLKYWSWDNEAGLLRKIRLSRIGRVIK